MIITDDLVFINYPKTGSTFVRQVFNELHFNKIKPIRKLQKVISNLGINTAYRNFSVHKAPNIRASGNPNRWMVPNEHGLRSQIPVSSQGKPIYSVKRNLFEQLVSLYLYGDWKISRINKKGHEEKYPNFPELSFEEFINFNYEFSSLGKHEWIKNMPNLSPFAMNYILFFSSNPFDILNNWNPVNEKTFLRELIEINFIDNKNLNNGLYSTLKKHGYSEEKISYIIEKGKVNQTIKNRNSYQSFYSKFPGLKEKIIERESFILSIYPEYLDFFNE